MSAHTFVDDEAENPVENPVESPGEWTLLGAAKKLGWVGITGLSISAGALFGMSLAVVFAAGTLVVGAIALVCVAAGIVLVAAGLLVVALLLVAGAALALALGIVALGLAGPLALGGWLARGIGSLGRRDGSALTDSEVLLQPSKSSAS